MEELAGESQEELSHIYTTVQYLIHFRGHLLPRYSRDIQTFILGLILPHENKENSPSRGKLLPNPLHKLHCGSELPLQCALFPAPSFPSFSRLTPPLCHPGREDFQ